MRITDKHVLFWGGVFSNFEPAPFYGFKTSEQYFMYCKALFFQDKESAEAILAAETPKEAKALGRKVKNFDADKWSGISVVVMRVALRYKFENNPHLMDELLKYPNKKFVEASPRDLIWGSGLAEDHPDADDESKWPGKNLLGKCLDQVRDEFIIKKKNGEKLGVFS